MRTLTTILVSCLAFSLSTQAKTIVVNTTDNNSSDVAQTNLLQAIKLLQDGDTIQFNIPGPTVHYIDTPVDGYPLITASGITIDGYSQPGATPNSNPLHAANNAQLKIVLSSTNGNGLSMQTAITNFTGVANDRLGFGPDELALLGFFRGSNITVRGIAFLSAPQVTGSGFTGDMKTISICPDSEGQCPNWHVSGCWFGVDPATRQVAYMPDNTTVAIPHISIAAYRSRDPDGNNPTYAQPGTVGVSSNSPNPRAEFNVFVTDYGFDSEGLNYRISGNFWNVLPDGMHNFDPSMGNIGQGLGDGYIEVGRVSDNLLIGTDSDGVNDEDEGNVFGGVASQDWANMYFWSSHATNVIFAGNWYGVAIDGSTTFTNTSVIIHGIPATAEIQFGSDLDGANDALEANRVFNNHPFTTEYADVPSTLEPIVFDISPGARLSVRGNTLVNNNQVPFLFADNTAGRFNNFTNYEAPYMSTDGDIIPGVDSTNSIFPNLVGTFPPGVPPYTNVTIDVYQLDQEGWNNGLLFNLIELTDGLTYSNGFPQGSKYLASFPVSNTGSYSLNIGSLDLGVGPLTITANYSQDPPGTRQGRTHTSNFSSPGTLLPGDAASAGLTHTVPDVALWYNNSGNYVTNGPIDLNAVQPTLSNWEPYVGVVGENTFLIGFNTFANDGTLANQNYVVAKQPAAGGPVKVDYEFYDDSGKPFTGQINLSRQNGNPQRVAGDKRPGATNFITEAETSIGQIPAFQTVNRWNNNPMYTNGNRYCSEQIFSLDPATLEQTPVTNAWDYVFGPFVATDLGAANGGQELSRTGGRADFLDNGNIVVMIDDKTALVSDVGQVTTFAIIKPDGTVVKGPTLVDPRDIWDNMAAYSGGFAIRVHNLLYFYDNAGSLQFTNDINLSSGLSFGTGREDASRIGSDIHSHYVYLAGQTPENSSSPVSVAIWDARNGNFITNATVTDGNPSAYKTDRVVVAVDAQDNFCVAYGFQPTLDFMEQVAARVMAFDGTNITYLTHSFFPFVNSENNPTNVLQFTTVSPSVAMTTRQICIAAKGTINSTNNPAGGPDSPAQTTVYTVINNPAAQGGVVPPVITVTQTGGQLIISWPVSAGTFSVQSTGTLAPTSWTTMSPQPPITQVGNNYQATLPIGAGASFFRLMH